MMKRAERWLILPLPTQHPTTDDLLTLDNQTNSGIFVRHNTRGYIALIYAIIIRKLFVYQAAVADRLAYACHSPTPDHTPTNPTTAIHVPFVVPELNEKLHGQ